MKVIRGLLSRTFFVAVAMLAPLLVVACNEQDDPFEFGERMNTPTPTADGTSSENGVTSKEAKASPTPLPTLAPAAAVATVEARETAHLASLFPESKGDIKMAEWDHKPLQFENALIGYFLVYGYDWNIEIIPTEQDNYQKALEKAEIDVVIEFDRSSAGDWYKTHIDNGAITDLGSMNSSQDNNRIVIHSGLAKRAPEAAELMRTVRPSPELIDKLSSSISSGRIGIKPTVAVIKFLKENEETWRKWLEPEVGEKIIAAVKGGKISLVNQKCIPAGGSGGAGSPNC